MVFVFDTHKKPLMPCREKHARLLLEGGRCYRKTAGSGIEIARPAVCVVLMSVVSTFPTP